MNFQARQVSREIFEEELGGPFVEVAAVYNHFHMSDGTTTPSDTDSGRASDSAGLNSKAQIEGRRREREEIKKYSPVPYPDLLSSSSDRTYNRLIRVSRFLRVAILPLAALILGSQYVSCGSQEDERAFVEESSTLTASSPKTCAEGNRATESDIHNRRVQLEEGVNTVILDCDKSGKLIGRCIFKNAQWPGDYSRPRTAEEGVDKIWFIEQDLNTRCRNYAVNLIKWANNYDISREDLVLPREVEYELV